MCMQGRLTGRRSTGRPMGLLGWPRAAGGALSQSLDRKAIRWCNFTEPHALKTTVIRGGEMKEQHLPLLGPRFWAALCLASVFGANMGDFFAHNIGLGHVAGLPFLVFGFALVMAIERFDRMAHETYYW